MAYTNISASQTDADSPVDQTLMDAIRTNLDDHESRIGTNEAATHEAILTDFTSVSFDTDDWTEINNIASVSMVTADHYARFEVSSAPAYDFLVASDKRMRFILDTAHTVVFETRVKRATTNVTEMLCGFQDVGIAADQYADLSDVIGFVLGATADTVKVRMAKAATATESGDVGNVANWTRLRLVVTKVAAGALTVAAELDGSAISGSPWSTNIPDTVQLRPVFGVSATDGTTRAFFFDYVRAYWLARPLSEA